VKRARLAVLEEYPHRPVDGGRGVAVLLLNFVEVKMEEDTVFRVADLDALQRNAAFHYRAAETKRRIRRHRALTVADPEVVSMFLITGATGNVGGEIVRHLLERNQKVRALVRGDASRVLHTDVEIATGDLNKPDDPYDIAAVAAAELTSDGHESRRLPVTGPEAITALDQVRILATVLGRDLRGESQPDEEAREEISRSMSPATAEAFYRFYAKGEFDDSAVSPTVQEITGRAPRSFEQWARTHAAKFQ
jgi:hypothetical protein